MPAGSGGFAAIQTAAPTFGVELTPVGVHDAGEIERGVTEFARGSNGGLIVVGPPSSMALHRDLIVTLAARHLLTRGLRFPLLRHRRRPDLLWGRCNRSVPARGRLCRSHGSHSGSLAATWGGSAHEPKDNG